MGKEEEKIKIGSISDFFGGEDTEDVDKFFSDDEDVIVVKETEEEKKKKKEEEKKTPDVFKEDDDDDEEEEKETVINNVKLITTLKEKGFIDFNEEENKELTEEEALEILEDSIEERIQTEVESKFADLPQIAIDFNKFIINGGDPNVFFDSVQSLKKADLSLNMDLTKVENQEKVLKSLLKEEGLDDDLIESQIEFLKDSNKLQSFSEKKYQTWTKKETERHNLILQEQESKRAKNKEQERKYRSEISHFVSKNDKVGDLTLNKQDKKEIVSYIMDRNVKLKNGQSISSFYADLEEVLSDNKTTLQLAKIMKLRDSKTGNFNFKEIEKELETSITKKVKEKINNEENLSPTSRKREGGKKMSLVDFLGN